MGTTPVAPGSESYELTYEQAADNILSRPNEASLTPETTEDATGQSTEELEGLEAETETDSPELEAEAETELSEEQLLPQKQERDYADTVYERYAKRYGKSLEEVKADPGLREALRQKIDTDIYVQEQKVEQERLKTELEQLKSAKDEKKPEELKPAATPEEAYSQYLQNLDKFAAEHSDPRMAEQFGKEYYKAWGLENPSAEDMARVAPLAKAYTKFGANLINTIAPQLIQGWIESAYPDFNANWQRTSYQRAWESARSGDPAYAKLPDYGSQDFVQLMEKAATIEPTIEQMVFRDANGRPLSQFENLVKQYNFAARLVAGQAQPAMKPETAKAAVDKGKALQKVADRKRAAGKVTGAGQTKGQFTPTDQGQGSGLGLVEAYANRHPDYTGST